jgi:hypothetical protein
MFDGKTLECLPLANTAILIRLLGELIETGVIARPRAGALLQDAVHDLENCPDSDRTNIEEAVRIIRRELMPRILESARVG